MNQQHLLVCSGKGEDEHQRIVQSEDAHVPAAVERTAAVCKVLVALQQTAVAPVDVLDDVLIASIIHTVDDGVAVSCVEGADALPFLLRDGAERVVNRQPEKDIAGRLTDAERLE